MADGPSSDMSFGSDIDAGMQPALHRPKIAAMPTGARASSES